MGTKMDTPTKDKCNMDQDKVDTPDFNKEHHFGEGPTMTAHNEDTLMESPEKKRY